MGPVLLDTSLYVSAFRMGQLGMASLRHWLPGSPLWLSSVVLAELYAGAHQQDVHAIERMESQFERISRILVPNLGDWTSTGRILAKLARKYDFEQIGRIRLINDSLIATSAARRGITVLTENMRDFARLAEFREFSWQVTAIPSI